MERERESWIIDTYFSQGCLQGCLAMSNIALFLYVFISLFPIPTCRSTKFCHALPCFNMHSPKPVLYTFLFLLPYADDDGAERQRSDIPDTDASELVS